MSTFISAKKSQSETDWHRADTDTLASTGFTGPKIINSDTGFNVYCPYCSKAVG